MAHRSWVARDGAPGTPYAIAQTKDGFLWLGTARGLYRFDGVSFDLYQPSSGGTLPSKLVNSLLALPDGRLWMGFWQGGVSLLENGKVTTYGEQEGVPNTPIHCIAQDKEGRMWASTDVGLIVFDGRRWELAGKKWSLPAEKSETVFVDTQGRVWAGVGNTVMYLPRGGKQFKSTGEFAFEVTQIAEGHDGRIWMADAGLAVRPIGMPGSRRAAVARCQAANMHETALLEGRNCGSANEMEIRVGAGGILFDREGNLWIATAGDGLYRVRHPEGLRDQPIAKSSKALESFTSADGLTADYAPRILDDREGNIWVFTRDGLDEFHNTKLVPIQLPSQSVSLSMAPENGGIWVSMNSGYVFKINGESIENPMRKLDAYLLYRDRRGVIWSQGRFDLYRLEKGKFRAVVALPPRTPDDLHAQIAEDLTGKMWIFQQRHGFLSLEHDKWTSANTAPEIAKLDPTTGFTDSQGKIWIGTDEGAIVTLEGGNIKLYAGADVQIGVVHAIYELGHHIWAGGSRGIALLDGEHFRHVTPVDSEAFTQITGVAGTETSGLWASGGSGVIHIPLDEVKQCLRTFPCRVHNDLFDSSDGLPGDISPVEPYRSSVDGTDGKVWFAATRGVAWIDPERIRFNPVTPPVSITSLLADGRTFSGLTDLRLAAHTQNIQIRYAGLSLTNPERVSFRYKLDGIDKAWQEPGTRREAYYSRLPPGHYTFHVIASNDDGLWNTEGARLMFIVAPAFYQTLWFACFVVVLGCLALWFVVRYRIRLATAQLEARLGERLAERERIARELHDTLIQSVQGLIFGVHALVQEVSGNEEPKKGMNRVLDRAEQILVEGRDRVRDLRTQKDETEDLMQALRRIVEELHEEDGLIIKLHVSGRVRPIQPAVEEEIGRLAKECISNAVRHSNGTVIRCQLSYEDKGLSFICEDDGVGINQELLVSKRKEGHWGLLGMRERAERIGATFNLASADCGTTIRISVPTRVAFIERSNRLNTIRFLRNWKRKI